MPIITIHSTVRGRSNRTQRAQIAGRMSLSQRVGNEQHRLVRGRPLSVTQKFLEENLSRLREQWKQGLIEVRVDGDLLNLDTMETKKVTLPTSTPNFPLDDVRNDRTWGNPLPPEVGDNLGEDGNLLDPNSKPSLIANVPSEEEEFERELENERLERERVEKERFNETPPPPPSASSFEKQSSEEPPMREPSRFPPSEPEQLAEFKDDPELAAALAAAEHEGEEDEGEEVEETDEEEPEGTTLTDVPPDAPAAQAAHGGKKKKKSKKKVTG